MSDSNKFGTRFLANRSHAVYYAKVLRRANSACKTGGPEMIRGLALFDLERRNIEAGQSWANAHSELDESAADISIYYGEAGSIV